MDEWNRSEINSVGRNARSARQQSLQAQEHASSQLGHVSKRWSRFRRANVLSLYAEGIMSQLWQVEWPCKYLRARLRPVQREVGPKSKFGMSPKMAKCHRCSQVTANFLQQFDKSQQPATFSSAVSHYYLRKTFTSGRGISDYFNIGHGTCRPIVDVGVLSSSNSPNEPQICLHTVRGVA